MRGVLVALSLLLCASCIGRPVVGERDPGDAAETGTCQDDEMHCGQFGVPPEVPGIDGNLFREQPCGDERMVMRVDDVQAIGDLDLRCRTLELTVGNEARVTLARPLVDDAHIVLIADGAAIVTIQAPVGNNVAIEVEGQSSLRLQAVAGMDGLRIDATSETIGWDVEIEDSALTAPAVRTGSDAQLVVRGSEVRDPVFQVGLLSLQTATVETATMQAKELIASGTDVRDSDLISRRSTFATGSMERVTLHDCETMLVGESVVEDADMGACAAGPLELRNTTVRNSILRGRSFALQSRINNSILGTELGSSVSLFDSRINFSLLCSVDAMAARGGTVLFCARCHPESPRAACIDESTAVAVVNCPELAMAETCDEGLPESLRGSLSDPILDEPVDDPDPLLGGDS